LLKLFGQRVVAYLVYHNLWGLRLGFRLLAPFYCKDRRWYNMMDRDLSRTTLESFLLSIASLRVTDLRPRLGRVKAPVMGMYGDKDIVVHPQQWRSLKDGVPHARIERFAAAGHFIMLDEPKLFVDTLKDFIGCEAAHA
jgi:pimeloyl-ACP methyl ester carboxylesterase